jgi:hypothetical protein
MARSYRHPIVRAASDRELWAVRPSGLFGDPSQTAAPAKRLKPRGVRESAASRPRNQPGRAATRSGSPKRRTDPSASASAHERAARDRIELGGIGLDVDISLVAELRILEA